MSFADIVTPEPGERVLLVPLVYSYMLMPQSQWNLIGKCADALRPHIPTDGGPGPRWVTYAPLEHPGIGYGLIVVRDGWCYRGPTQWDGLT